MRSEFAELRLEARAFRREQCLIARRCAHALVTAWCLVTSSACGVAADYSDSEFQCPDGVCPAGFECVQSRCVSADEQPADASTDATETPVAVVDAQLPDAGDAPRGLLGTYFHQVDLVNQAFTRVDPVVDFVWDREAPDPTMAPDGFSVRWSGTVRPRYSELYTFYVLSDDGARLWVDGALLIDDWTTHTELEESGTIALQADTDYTIELEYFDDLRAATVRLLWSSPTQPKQVVSADRLAPLPE